MKKKIRVNITVDLEVGENFDIQKDLAVVKYEGYGYHDEFLPKTEDFEVIDYIKTEEV